MRQMKHIIDGLTRPAGGNWTFAAAFGAVPILYLIPAASRFYVNEHAVFAIIPWCANSLFLAILLRTRREAWPPATTLLRRSQPWAACGRGGIPLAGSWDTRAASAGPTGTGRGRTGEIRKISPGKEKRGPSGPPEKWCFLEPPRSPQGPQPPCQCFLIIF